MKYQDVKDLAKNDLYKELKAQKDKLFMLRMKNKMDQLSNPLEIRFLKKDIARLSTALTVAK